MAVQVSLEEFLEESSAPVFRGKEVKVPNDPDVIGELVAQGWDLRGLRIDLVLAEARNYEDLVPSEVRQAVITAAFDLHEKGPYHYEAVINKLMKKYEWDERVLKFLRAVSIPEDEFLPLYVMHQQYVKNKR
ncbi:hypothetical protein D9Q81_01290 [Candidatus Korarchaeum cryptofilum]|uniref:Uncharacterized protein n=1 Tax=Candidatus Korarchaeum cryptofilum TaxID=498846 RepID=A0A429G9A2_9CREN|nr:hypothetical protein [Candidatus Korarchaeum cryptofilum]RSN70332.1 hypothetical protein D9Q81_01290 [Candidatus Korarchaeum cryptofilum]